MNVIRLEPYSTYSDSYFVIKKVNDVIVYYIVGNRAGIMSKFQWSLPFLPLPSQVSFGILTNQNSGKEISIKALVKVHKEWIECSRVSDSMHVDRDVIVVNHFYWRNIASFTVVSFWVLLLYYTHKTLLVYSLTDVTIMSQDSIYSCCQRLCPHLCAEACVVVCLSVFFNLRTSDIRLPNDIRNENNFKSIKCDRPLTESVCFFLDSTRSIVTKNGFMLKFLHNFQLTFKLNEMKT